MAAVTITLPDIPPEVDHADMLRACVAQLAAGHPLADLRGRYVRAILTRLADVLDDGPELRCPVPADLGYPGGLAWFVEQDAQGRWTVIGAPAVDTALPGVVLAVEHAEDEDGADVSEEAARAVHAAIQATIAAAPPLDPAIATTCGGDA